MREIVAKASLRLRRAPPASHTFTDAGLRQVWRGMNRRRFPLAAPHGHTALIDVWPRNIQLCLPPATQLCLPPASPGALEVGIFSP